MKQPANKGVQRTKEEKKHKGPEPGELDLPDVKDIPGQEHVRPPDLKEFRDITPASDDEEGKGIEGFDDELTDKNTNVSKEESQLLQRSADSMGSKDDQSWEESTLDNLDGDGEPLNEQNEFSGTDLDVPGAEADDANEEIGEEDEENNSYSLGGDKND